MLKCSYGFNPYAVQQVAINKYGSNKCLQYGAIEDWEHIIKCSFRKKERDQWKKKTRNLVQKIKQLPEAIKIDAGTFINDIHEYLQGWTNVPGTQNVIGFKYLFRGFVVRDWFGANELENKYSKANKVIVEQSVKFYQQC